MWVKKPLHYYINIMSFLPTPINKVYIPSYILVKLNIAFSPS